MQQCEALQHDNVKSGPLGTLRVPGQPLVSSLDLFTGLPGAARLLCVLHSVSSGQGCIGTADNHRRGGSPLMRSACGPSYSAEAQFGLRLSRQGPTSRWGAQNSAAYHQRRGVKDARVLKTGMYWKRLGG